MVSTVSGTVGSAVRKPASKKAIRPSGSKEQHPGASRLQELASSLPRELITTILEFAAQNSSKGTWSNKGKVHLLCLSKHYHARLAPYLYSTVALSSSSAIHAFAALVKGSTRIARYVTRLWIGPDDSSSDLITALSPPVYNEAQYITDMRDEVHTSVRTILRACRKLHDVALAGELLSLYSAHTYGSACQPVRLTSVNPHSFVGGFSAPIFRKVKVLRIIDTNLAFEEADEIRTLSDLEWLIWTAPKDYGDITRDSNVLRRLLQRPKKHFLPPPQESESQEPVPEPSSPSANGTTAVSMIDELWTDLSSLELSEGLAPARPSKNDRFRRLTIQTAHNRCEEFKRMLADSFPLLIDDAPQTDLPASAALERDGLLTGLNATWEDLEREWNPDLHIPTIHPTPLTGIVLDEWDALRDLINNAAGQYSNLSMFDDAEHSAVVDAGNALRRQRRVWEHIRDLALP